MKPTRNINYWIRPHSVGDLSWREIFNCREMIRNLIRSSALLPYSETYFGYFWTLLRPFIFLGVLVFIKNRSMANMGEEIPYPLFLFSGLVLWWYMVDAIRQSARSTFTYKGLITKIYFPRVIIPVVPVIARFFDLSLQAIGLIGLMVFYGQYPGGNILLLPLVFLNIGILCLGVGFLFSVLSVVLKDMERILDYVLYVGMFVSPVIYAIELIPPEYRMLYSWVNPTVGPLMAFRAALFSDLTPDYVAFFHSFVVSGILLLVGVVIFQRMQVLLAERM